MKVSTIVTLVCLLLFVVGFICLYNYWQTTKDDSSEPSKGLLGASVMMLIVGGFGLYINVNLSHQLAMKKKVKCDSCGWTGSFKAHRGKCPQCKSDSYSYV